MAKVNLEELKRNAIIIEEPDFSKIDGKYLRAFRMQMKMSQVLFADYLGVSKKAIEKWEQGKNKVNPVVARMIYLIEKDPNILSMLKNIKVENLSVNYASLLNNNQIIVENDKIIDDCLEEVTITSIKHDIEWEPKNIKLIGKMSYGKATSI